MRAIGAAIERTCSNLTGLGRTKTTKRTQWHAHLRPERTDPPPETAAPLQRHGRLAGTRVPAMREYGPKEAAHPTPRNQPGSVSAPAPTKPGATPARTLGRRSSILTMPASFLMLAWAPTPGGHVSTTLPPSNSAARTRRRRPDPGRGGDGLSPGLSRGVAACRARFLGAERWIGVGATAERCAFLSQKESTACQGRARPAMAHPTAQGSGGHPHGQFPAWPWR